MNFEWIMNDLKVEQLALEMKSLRIEYLKITPNASETQIDNYINKKLKNKAKDILIEQISIVSDSLD